MSDTTTEMTNVEVDAALADIRNKAFIGPLPEHLRRDPYTAEPIIPFYVKNPRDFALAAAAYMRFHGREVEVREEVNEYGTLAIYVFSPAPRWYDAAVTVHAVKPGQRWRFLGASAIGKRADAKSISRARGLVSTYGR